VRDTLDRLLARCPSAVRIVYIWRTGRTTWPAATLVSGSWTSAVADRSAGVLDTLSPDAVVVFDAGGKEGRSWWDELLGHVGDAQAQVLSEALRGVGRL
jgi:hypothetical protein